MCSSQLAYLKQRPKCGMEEGTQTLGLKRKMSWRRNSLLSPRHPKVRVAPVRLIAESVDDAVHEHARLLVADGCERFFVPCHNFGRVGGAGLDGCVRDDH